MLWGGIWPPWWGTELVLLNLAERQTLFVTTMDVVNDNLINAHDFSHNGVLLKSVMSQDQILQSVFFSQFIPIVQNWVFSLWPDGRRDQKSFPLDYLMVLWFGSCLGMSGEFQFLSSSQLVWVRLQTSSDLLDTFFRCCTCPKNVWGIAAFFLWKALQENLLWKS